MSDIKYIITGSRGSIGGKVENYLSKRHICNSLKIKDLLTSLLNEEFQNENIIFENFINNMKLNFAEHYTIIFSHRLRSLENDVHKYLYYESFMVKKIIENIKSKCNFLNIVFIGSCTGNLYHKNSRESYHYVKDLQKSISRYYGTSEKNIRANVIELSVFEKYNDLEQKEEYKKSMLENKTQKFLDRDIVTYKELFELINFLSIKKVGISGEILRLDNSFQNIQQF